MARTIADFDTAHCGVIHDAQLDNYGRCLATASSDGHIRLWDLAQPKEPRFLADLGGNAGAVYQVAWAPAEVGLLLASAGSDGRVIIWGRRCTPSEWMMVHQEDLERHGAVRSLAWSPFDHGVVLACVSEDGTLTVIAHQGVLRSGDSSIRHLWQSSSHSAHRLQASSVAWAPPPLREGPPALTGARLATAGGDGVRVWDWDAARNAWQGQPLVDAADVGAACVRDVAWKPWDGECDMLASAEGREVTIWLLHPGDAHGAPPRWKAAEHVAVGEEVWRLSWMDTGNVLLLSCGEEEQRTVLMKQRLSGEWDLVDVSSHSG